MFTQKQLIVMLDLQNSMNIKVNPDWVNAGSDWSLAAMMEATEAIDHHGWKWWKKQTPDMPQLQMELVDIWHFMLSQILEHSCEPDNAIISEALLEWIEETNESVRTTYTFNNTVFETRNMSLPELLKVFAGSCGSGQIPAHLFLFILERSGMTTDDLYKQYIGKNVLNFFRQDNGYKAGTYQKLWFGREDNEHLTELMAQLDPTADDFSTRLYDGLSSLYRVTTQVGVA
jgi:dimeric dUTPase (all-alpha-NTP-PPase superfamily)